MVIISFAVIRALRLSCKVDVNVHAIHFLEKNRVDSTNDKDFNLREKKIASNFATQWHFKHFVVKQAQKRVPHIHFVVPKYVLE